MYMGQCIYCGHHTTLSIGDVLPLRGVLKGAVTCSVELHAGKCSASAGASRDYNIVVSRNPDSDASAGASRDYDIVVSRNLDSDASARASRDYAIIISHKPDNGIRAGNASHQRRDTVNDSKVDEVRRPLALLLLRQQRLLSKGGSHHLIYVG
ncbi:uncharacterized protein [Miscanthus floridulus]|uniref:uncharacterized protein n=1 Tax=Miscanthus floridulus TaxID=154761 RepID=UPI00345792C2